MAGRRESGSALWGYEERYRWLTESLPVAVFMTSSGPPFTLLSANPVFLRMLGYSSEQELAGRPVTDLFATPGMWEPFARSLSEENATRVIEARLNHRSGTEIWVNMGIRAVCDSDDGIIAIEGFARDTTESRAYEMEMRYHEKELSQYASALEQANRKLNLLASITRHDIINQLTALMMTTQLMEQECMDEKLRQYISMQEDITGRIRQQILFTKDYHEIGVRSPVWFDVKKGILSAAAALPLKAGVLTVDENIAVVIYADPLIERVFFNLMENALRHAPDLTRIGFSSRAAGEDLVLVCDDDGPGVPSKYKEDIFTRRHFKHTGFGLFLSREILGITGLSIRETGDPGNGARFEITVPKGSFRSGPPVMEPGA